MVSYHAPQEWKEWVDAVGGGLDSRVRWRWPLLLIGLVFGAGRRVVAAWLRAAGVSDDYRAYYDFLQSIGRRCPSLSRRLLVLVAKSVLKGDRVTLAIDDSPTKRYGPKVQGAGIHHDPTPGPAQHGFCYGHVWVTLAVIARHPLWNTIGLPICAALYVRKQDVELLPAKLNWTFQTKLEQARDLVLMAAEILQLAGGKTLWVVTDGAYAKRPFVGPVKDMGVTLVGRLRKDAALWDVPQPPAVKRRGRPRIYGPNRISLKQLAAEESGWSEVSCHIYGSQVTKRAKSFIGTHRTFGGAIRVVIVQEASGPQYFYCTNLEASIVDIIETFADRTSIEQVFHDVKEVWGSGQQQVRNIWSNIACWHLNLWLHTLVELWAWDKPAKELTHREHSPWDDPHRRPSHADRRKALQAACLTEEFSATLPRGSLPPEIRTILARLLQIPV